LPAIDRAPPTDVVGRREGGDAAVVVVRREAGDAPNLAEGAAVEQEVDALSARQLAALTLPDDSGLVRPRGEPLVGQRLELADLAQDGVPCLLGRPPAPGLVDGGLGDDGDDLAGGDRVPRPEIPDGG